MRVLVSWLSWMSSTYMTVVGWSSHMRILLVFAFTVNRRKVCVHCPLFVMGSGVMSEVGYMVTFCVTRSLIVEPAGPYVHRESRYSLPPFTLTASHTADVAQVVVSSPMRSIFEPLWGFTVLSEAITAPRNAAVGENSHVGVLRFSNPGSATSCAPSDSTAGPGSPQRWVASVSSM